MWISAFILPIPSAKLAKNGIINHYIDILFLRCQNEKYLPDEGSSGFPIPLSLNPFSAVQD